MTVKRIVANIEVSDLSAARHFYHEILALDVLMDHGWIITYGNEQSSSVQISFAMEGGNGTPVPDLSIEVDDLELIYNNMLKAGYKIEYGPVDEPWGVKRFFVRDPYGKLVNILSHV